MSSLLIDGSVLEGGGQILRNSVALSALLHKPIPIYNIRQGRHPSGLKNQHRVGIQLAADICHGLVTGVSNGSTKIDFHPGRIQLPCHVDADAITAGSTTLLLQTALPMMLFAGASDVQTFTKNDALCSSGEETTVSTLSLRGGTNAGQAPQIEYTQHVLVPFLKKHFGLNDGLEVRLKRRGYYPKGGGEVLVKVPGRKDPLKAIQLLTRGRVLRITGLSHVGLLPTKLASNMAEGAMQRLALRGYHSIPKDGIHSVEQTPNNIRPIPIEIHTKRERNEECPGAGSGIVLWAELEDGGMIGSSALGKKGISPFAVGEAAADELVRGLEAGGCVDEYLQDQIIIFMALAAGCSSVRTGALTLHTKTAIWVAEQLTNAKFEVILEESGGCIIHCHGIGYESPLTALEDRP